MNKLTVRDVDVSGKKVLVRTDFNVPLDEKTGAITDDSRIQATLPTIRYLIERKAKVIIASHLGRPKGKVVASLSLAPIARRLSQLLEQQVMFASDCIGPDAERSVATMKEGEVLVLENLRFNPDEKANNADFARALASLAEVFVNDAFGTSHRADASITGVTEYLPAVAGLLLEKEVDTLGSILKTPNRPFAALLGGAKVSDKVGMLENIINKVDSILIGGGMAATFLKARACEIGASLVENDKLDFAAKLMQETGRRKINLLLPIDAVIADEPGEEANAETVSIENVPSHSKILDIGPRTIERFSDELQRCKTVFWNGPMGIYEIPQFATGTKSIAKVLAELGATTIIGGGSTSEVVTEMGLGDKMTFVSTGGGASLTFLSGEVLPGVEALLDK